MAQHKAKGQRKKEGKKDKEEKTGRKKEKKRTNKSLVMRKIVRRESEGGGVLFAH